MKKKVLIGLGIIIVVGAVAGGILFTRGKGEDNTVNAVASIETVSTVETEPEESKETEEISVDESEEIKVEETESESEETLEEEDTIEETNTDILPLDKVMYSKGEVNTRIGPSTDYTKSPSGPLTLNQEVHVTGQSRSTNWYQLTLPSNEIVYVSDQYLSDTKTEIQQSKPSTNTNKGEESNSNQNQGQQQPETPQPSTPPTQPEDTNTSDNTNPSGGIESGNLGGANGFGSVTNDGGAWDGKGYADPAH